jgi:peptide chain release factor subunit 1
MEFRDGLPRELTPLTDIEMRLLADTSDARDVHLSVYLPTASRGDEQLNLAFVASRVKAIRKALEGEVEKDFEATFRQVEELLFHNPIPGERGRVVYASAPSEFFVAYRLGVEPERKVVLDNSPFILPLMEMMDDYEDYGILLMDSDEARLYIVSSNIIEQVDSSSIDLMNRHKKGGMSQKRFNRLRRGAIDAFISQIIEDLEKLDGLDKMRGLVVAGPGKEKKQLVAALPGKMAERVIGILDVSIEIPPHSLLARGEEIAIAHEREEDSRAIEELRRAIFKDEMAAVGINEVRDALVQGRVEKLLVSKDLSIPGWICENCKGIHMGAPPEGSCPDCDGPISGAELVNELAEMVQRTDAEMEFVAASPFLESIGGLGATLRY